MMGTRDPLEQIRDEFPVEGLLAWYQQEGREPLWGDQADPYRVWVAVAMLHQTRFETVIPYYRRFVERFPDVVALAQADLEDVLRVWEGLGYYRRARHLQQAAGLVVAKHAGRVPADWGALRGLPGVGDYTASAILSIAFGKGYPAVDGNVARVLSRWFGLKERPSSAGGRRQLTDIAWAVLPPGRASEFNQALMDLGALVCRPRSPGCETCPLEAGCAARRLGWQSDLPRRAASRPIPHHQVAAAVLVRDGQVLIAQRHPDDMLGGLWEFPGGKQEGDESLPECLRREIREELGIAIRVGGPLIAFDHAYTHFRITLHAFWCSLEREDETPQCLGCADWRWVRPDELDRFPLSAADRKVARALSRAQEATTE